MTATISKFRETTRPAWPVLLLVLAFATPPETSLNLGGLRLSPYRLVVIAALFPCLHRLVSGAAGAWQWSDGLFLFHGVWATIALVKYAGIGQGLESGGIYFVEAVGGYLVGRCYVRRAADFRAVARLMLGVVSVMMLVAFVESITGNHFIRDTARRVLGGPSLVPIEPRLGLHRAYASFDHPILYGIFCASTLGMAFYLPAKRPGSMRTRARPMISGLATFFSLSAGALSALGIQLFIAGWDICTRGITKRWAVLGSIIAGIWTVLTLLSNRGPIKVFLAYGTFSPGTGYNRLRIWEYGSAEVQRHPIFGIGLGEWQRPVWMVSSSMDNFWLATAVRYGLPAFIVLAAAVMILIWKQASLRSASPEICQCRSAWVTSMVGLSIAGCTVHFWNALFCLFCFLVGTGVWMAESRPRR